MKYTGERYLSSLDAPETSYEHWHRYLYSTLFCKDKVVLDVACGEGYGSYLLSKYSKKVVGIDIDYDVINFASREYINNNLEFIVGNVNNLPIKGKCLFDLIVSFEAIEHIDEKNQIKLLTEVKRLLKPGGVLIISTPNKSLYTDVLKNKNKFHVKEFYLNEFNDFLKKYFQNVKIMGQKIYSSSYIWNKDKNYGEIVEFELTYKNNRFLPSKNEKRILYAIAVCSDEKLDEIQHSLLLDTSDRLTNIRDECIAKLQNKISKMETHYVAQLFIDTGKGTSEEQSIIKEISGKEEELEFDVSRCEGIEALRFDPLNDMVRLKLEEIVIIDDKNKGHQVHEYKTNCSYERGKYYTFETNDPVISFSIKDIVNAKKVILHLNYILLGNEVSRYLVNLKQDEIARRDEEVRKKEAELSQKDLTISTLKEKVHELEPHYAAQLFIDIGKGISEEQSIINEISGKETELEFDVSRYEGIEALRFDPLNDMVRLKLEEIVIIDDNNKRHQVLDYKTNCFYKRDKYYTFETNDPIISFKVRDIGNAGKVIIRLKYILLGDEVSRYIVKLKHEEIQKRDKEIEQRDGEIRKKESELNQRDSVIMALRDTLKQKIQQIEYLENEIKSLEDRVKRTDEQLLSLKESNHQKDEKIKNLHSDIQLKEKQFNRFLDTWSWKITTPLRKLYSLIPGKNKKNQILKPDEPSKEINVHGDIIEILFDGVIVVGWASSKGGIDKIEIYIDGVLVGNAQYGFPRSDVTTSSPHIKNIRNPGFLFYSALNNKQLSYPELAINIRAVNRDGEKKEIRQSISNVDNRYIEYLNRTSPTGSSLSWMKKNSHRFYLKEHIAIGILVNKTTVVNLSAAIHSIITQVYPGFSIFVFFENDLSESFLKTHDLPVDKIKIYPIHQLYDILTRVEDNFLCLIQSGVILLPGALFEIVKEINIDRNVDLIYADEDRLVNNKRKIPFFKPGWSPELLLSMNYIGHFFVFKKDVFTSMKGLKKLSSSALMYDLLLRIGEMSNNIARIPRVLFSNANDIEFHVEETKTVLEDSLARRHIDGAVLFLTPSNLFRVRKKIVNCPKVSIIISTAKNPGINIKPCLISIIEKSSYKNYEIILIDNSFGEISLNEIKKIVPQNIPLKIINYKKEFNFSTVNNIGARKAEGKYLIFLNDDTEVISPGWIEAMLEHAQAPGIGAVGAKLLYKNKTIQHAGMFLLDHGGGGGHWFKYCTDKDFGFHGLLNTARPCSAVTFACAMVPKQVFDSLDGLDEKLNVECNDVDFCLRAINDGFRIIWTPFARLYHKESITRKSLSNSGQITNADNYKYFRDRWRNVLEKGDPFYNPNLSLDSEIYSLATRPVLIEHHEPDGKPPDWLDNNSISALPQFNPEIDEKILKGFEEFINCPLLVGISPFGKKPIQQWPLDYFSRLVDLLVEEKNANLIVFGEEEEQSTFKKTFHSRKRKERLKFFGGKWFNNQFLSLLKQCHLFIGTRNEYVHTAAQLGIPTLSILAGDILPGESHPLGEKTMSIRIAVDCSPCYKESIEQCPHDLKCLKFLWPQKVIDGVNQLLAISGY